MDDILGEWMSNTRGSASKSDSKKAKQSYESPVFPEPTAPDIDDIPVVQPKHDKFYVDLFALDEEENR